MPKGLYWNTVTEHLQLGLQQIMSESLFNQFRLVGGTSLSLQLGHRISVDIDLFTDADYGSIDFKAIDTYLRGNYAYVSPSSLPDIISMGISYFIGNTKDDSYKLDLYYTEGFIRPVLEMEQVRMATQEEIIAMKLDVIQRGGRKKDFWDLDELLNTYSLKQMIELHEERYPFNHDEVLIRNNFVDFSIADEEPDPDCLRGKHWEVIKLDLIEMQERN